MPKKQEYLWLKAAIFALLVGAQTTAIAYQAYAYGQSTCAIKQGR